ncbi:response regulator [Candidatus Woesearchaeota archaeon]|nr:response regulator [Candidatus Woesearchaeota archaeon]
MEGDKKYHIIAVDDDASIRNVMSYLLTSSGKFTVYMCSTPEEVIDRLTDLVVNEDLKNHYDALITDLRMPRENDGINLAKKVKEMVPKMPIYAISGTSFDLEGKDGDFQGVISKPFDALTLPTTIKEMIDAHYSKKF